MNYLVWVRKDRPLKYYVEAKGLTDAITKVLKSDASITAEQIAGVQEDPDAVLVLTK